MRNQVRGLRSDQHWSFWLSLVVVLFGIVSMWTVIDLGGEPKVAMAFVPFVAAGVTLAAFLYDLQ